MKGVFFYNLDSAPQKPDKAVYYDKDTTTGVGFFDGIFQYFFGGFSIKVTGLPFYSALEIEPTINISSGDLDVFVNRTLLRIWGTRTEGSLGDNREYLNLFYSVIPKSLFGNDELRIERDFGAPEFETDFLKALQTHPSARQIFYNDAAEVYSDGVLSLDWDDPAYSYSTTINYVRPSGALMGVVKKGNNWYFFWQS